MSQCGDGKYNSWNTGIVFLHSLSCFIKFTPCLLAPGMQVGDQIMEVNGHSFRSIAHDEAVQILKSSRHMLMTVKDVGRLPHARTVVDETKWISSPQIAESSASATLRSFCFSQPISCFFFFLSLTDFLASFSRNIEEHWGTIT